MTPFTSQVINLFASVLLLIAFAMLAQRRIVTLINLFAVQGLALVGSTVTVAWATGQHHLYWSAGITFVLKVVALPLILTASRSTNQVLVPIAIQVGGIGIAECAGDIGDGFFRTEVPSPVQIFQPGDFECISGDKKQVLVAIAILIYGVNVQDIF